MLLNPMSSTEMIEPATVRCMARTEAFAEKYRAALTRRDVAIRDFYDIDHAGRSLGMVPEDAELRSLVKQKLAVPGNDAISIGPDRLAQLRGQLETRLKPVLRQEDFDGFDLDRAFGMAVRMARLITS